MLQSRREKAHQINPIQQGKTIAILCFFILITYSPPAVAKGWQHWQGSWLSTQQGALLPPLPEKRIFPCKLRIAKSWSMWLKILDWYFPKLDTYKTFWATLWYCVCTLFRWAPQMESECSYFLSFPYTSAKSVDFPFLCFWNVMLSGWC